MCNCHKYVLTYQEILCTKFSLLYGISVLIELCYFCICIIVPISITFKVFSALKCFVMVSSNLLMLAQLRFCSVLSYFSVVASCLD